MSTGVIKYEGSITVEGQVGDFERIIDPQSWSDNFPFIWPQSYLINGSLPSDRDPAPPGLARVATMPRFGFLFEQVLFAGGILYSNVIDTDLQVRDGGLLFRYSEVDCRTTDTLLNTVDGGIDIDNGFALVVPAEGMPGFVTVTVTKEVRFTEPSPFVDNEPLFFEAVVKLSMDALLQSLIFVGALT